jgi:Protein of unknown function (DUF1592)/Protein of unknown function (DUF1588)/Protein of unknown function (DUF1595)/Protein of unknown function (DUF1585)
MRARSTRFLSLCLATSAACLAISGCNGSIGTSGAQGSGTGVGTGAAGSGVSGVGTGTGGSGTGGTGVGTGTGGTGTTGAAGTGIVTLPNSALESGSVLRLANYEFTNSIHDLLGITPNVPLEPDAPSTGDFRIGGPAGDNTVSTYHAAAMTLAAQALKTLATIEPCYGTATTAATQATCASTIASDLGPKFYRRPLDPAQMTGLTGVYTTIAGKYGFANGVQAMLEALIQSPYFLYHLELEEEAMGAPTGMAKVAVGGYSMASRLSYLLWGSTPDATLITAAGMGQLTTPAQVSAQATRMLTDPRAVGGMRNFYEQWLKVLDLPTSKVKNPVTNTDYASLYTPDVQTSLRASFDAQVDAALWGTGDAVKALLTGTDAYVDGNIASIFGATATGTTLQKITVNPAQRAGIMTHPALMSIFATETASHPIKRGVFFWDKFLCQPLPNPPPNVPPFVAPAPGQSLRKDFEVMTADPTTCQPCHKRINPLGFLFEHYDSMGYYVTTDSNGQPVDSATTLVGTGDPMLDVANTDAVQFAGRLGADDSTVATCMVNQIYRYAVHRHEEAGDVMALASLTSSFNTSGRNVKMLLSSLTQSEAFLYRLNVQ